MSARLDAQFDVALINAEAKLRDLQRFVRGPELYQIPFTLDEIVALRVALKTRRRLLKALDEHTKRGGQ